MKFTMRDYQTDWCREVWRAVEHGIEGNTFSRVLGCAATGAGKTIMATALIEKWRERGQRSLFIADTDELCAQAVDKMHKAAGIIADLEKAESKASRTSPVVVGSIQTMAGENRMDRFPADHFQRVIADEAHLSMAANWQRVLQRFNGGGAKIVGITATPERSDGIPLMSFYEHMAAEIPLFTLIDRKHLSPIVVRTVPLEITITGKVKEGEMEDIAAQLDAYTQAIIDSIETFAADRKKILIFHPSVNASQRFTEALQARGHAARHVDGNSPDRREILAGYARGDFRILNNAQLLIKGYDEPTVDCVIILRPTKSRTAYIQMVGRGTRLFCPHNCDGWCEHEDRKQNMLLLDFLWQFPGMNVMAPACLATDKPEQAAAIQKKLRSEGGELDIMAVDKAALSEREEQLVSALKRAGKKRAMILDARQFGAVMHQPELMDYEPRARWEQAPMTEKQAKALAGFGVDPKTVSGKGHASHLLNFLFSRMKTGACTVKQVLMLNEFGVDGALEFSKDDASRVIGENLARRRSA